MNFARISRPRTRRGHGLHPDGNRVVSQSSSNSNCERIQRAFEDEFEDDSVAAPPRRGLLFKVFSVAFLWLNVA
jgi:hypothetical protein